MNEIINIDDSRIELYKNLRHTPASHIENKLFITEGEKATLELIKSGIKVSTVFAVKEFYQKNSDLILQKNIPEDKLFFADKSIMNQIVGFKLHSGVMAIAHQPEESSLEELNSPIVLLNGIINSENVGSIIRNCAAFSVSSLIVDKTTSSPYLRRAVRVSMGTVFGMKLHYSKDTIITIRVLKDLNYKIIASEITGKAQSINSFKFPKKFCIIFGSEGYGITENILSISDKQIYVPINKIVKSLNVAASSAIILSKFREKFPMH